MSSEVTVKQLATTVGIPVERLLTQLNEAGVPAGAEDAPISEHQKLQLLNYLRRSHGAKTATDEPEGTTARKAADPRPPLGVGRAGARVPASRPNPNARAAKSVNVEVKRKRTFVKGDEAPAPTAKAAAPTTSEVDQDSHGQPPTHQPAPQQVPPTAVATATPAAPADAVDESRAADAPAGAPVTVSATPADASPKTVAGRSAPPQGPTADAWDDLTPTAATASPPARTATGQPAAARGVTARSSFAQSPAGRPGAPPPGTPGSAQRPGPGRGATGGRPDGRPAPAARPAPARRPGGGRVVMDEARRRGELEARRAEEDARRLAEQEENERRAREEAQRRAETDAKRRAAAKAAVAEAPATADTVPTTAPDTLGPEATGPAMPGAPTPIAATTGPATATPGLPTPANATPGTQIPATTAPETGTSDTAAPTGTAAAGAAPLPPAAPPAPKVGAKARPGTEATVADDSDEDAESKRRAGKKAPERVEKDKKAAKPARKETWAKQAVAGDDDDDSGVISRPAVRRRSKKGAKPQLQDKHGFQRPTAPVVREVEVPESITVGELASRMSVKAAQVVKALFKQGMMVTVNQTLDRDTAILLVEEMGHTAVEGREQDAEDSLLAWLEEERGQIVQSPRPPVVTIMGHVDHGKTSLLDYIRRTKVASGEAGGITQHIGAYHVDTPKGTVSFLDTPGHAAFSAMRARGAKVTDLVVLVVAADDGVMPQTVEAIQHARASGVPIIVAVNKMDLPDANPDRVMQELVQREVVPEAWGGDTMMVQVSAKTGDGIDDLLDAILLQAEVLELTASVTGAARGTIVESSIEKGRGPVATVLVSSGTLNVGDTIVSGGEYGRVRAMFDEAGRPVKSAGPSIPVQVLGLSGAPNAGDDVLAVTDERRAREVAEFRQDRERQTRMDDQRGASLDQLFNQFKEGELKSVNIILKADVQGSVEALKDSLVKLSNDEVKVTVVASGVGGIAESDANLAVTSNAILLGFNVRADPAARRVIEEKGLDLRYYSIIYELIDDVKLAISGLLSPIVTEEIIGLAQVRDVFRSSKFGAIAGCMVVEGQIRRNAPIRVLRNNVVVYEGALESLRRFKDDVSEVKAGIECGIGVKNYNDVQPGDQIEVFERTERARVL